MLARNHISFATALAMGSAVLLDKPFFLPFIVFAIIGGLLPDIDHAESKINNYFPVIDKFLKHRGPTHSILGVAVFYGSLYFLLGFNKTITIIFAVLSFVGITIVKKAIQRNIRKSNQFSLVKLTYKKIKRTINIITTLLFVLFAITVYLTWQSAMIRNEILYLLCLGLVAHILADLVTKEGLPIFWPIKKRFSLGLFKTGSTGEKVFGALLILLNFYLLFLFFQSFNLTEAEYWNGYLRYLPTSEDFSKLFS